MVQIVPDDYFPIVEEKEKKTTTKSSSSFYYYSPYSFSQIYSSSNISFLNFTFKTNETLQTAINAITYQMENDNLEAACQLTEINNFNLEMLAVNATLLITTVDIVLGIIARPIYNVFQVLLKTYNNENGIGITFYPSSLSFNKTTKTSSSIININSSGSTRAVVDSLNHFWASLLSLDEAWKRYAELAMILICVSLFILIIFVRLRFSKYFRVIDMQGEKKQSHSFNSSSSNNNNNSKKKSSMKKRKLFKDNNIGLNFFFPPPEEISNVNHKQGLPNVMMGDEIDSEEGPSSLSFTLDP